MAETKTALHCKQSQPRVARQNLPIMLQRHRSAATHATNAERRAKVRYQDDEKYETHTWPGCHDDAG